MSAFDVYIYIDKCWIDNCFICMAFMTSWVLASQTITVHYDDVIMSTIASQITSLTIVYSTVYSSADQSKHQSSASLAFVWEIHRGPVNFPHKWPVTRKMFPFDDVIMTKCQMDVCLRPSKHISCIVLVEIQSVQSCITKYCWLMSEKQLSLHVGQSKNISLSSLLFIGRLLVT